MNEEYNVRAWLAATSNVGYCPSQRIRVKRIQEKGSHEGRDSEYVRQEDIESSERMETREGREDKREVM